MKETLRHYLNPLHVYCRIYKIFGKKRSRSFCNRYETVYKLVLG